MCGSSAHAHLFLGVLLVGAPLCCDVQVTTVHKLKEQIELGLCVEGLLERDDEPD